MGTRIDKKKVQIINTIISLAEYKEYFLKGKTPPDELVDEIRKLAGEQDNYFYNIEDFKEWLLDNWDKLKIDGKFVSNAIDTSDIKIANRLNDSRISRGSNFFG